MEVLKEYARVVVITHNSPDPDAIAAGWALHTLVKSVLEKPVRLIGGGAIVRAENVFMVERLKPPLELVDSFEPEEGCAPVLVDCGPDAANHLLREGELKPVGVIDHHQSTRTRKRLRFRDVRPRAAAAATITGQYLREQKVEPEKLLATGLLYAVRTETLGRHRPYTRTDRGVVSWLAERADHQLLTEIQNAPLPPEYFDQLLRALASAFLYGSVGVCFMPEAGGPEIVGEVADLLIRCTGVERVLCGAKIDDDLVLSSRATAAGGDATALLEKTLGGLGPCGGHQARAGGKVAAGEEGRVITQELLDEVKGRWLEVCGVKEGRGNRLVARRDVMDLF